jgi:hypothetical protein
MIRSHLFAGAEGQGPASTRRGRGYSGHKMGDISIIHSGGLSRSCFYGWSGSLPGPGCIRSGIFGGGRHIEGPRNVCDRRHLPSPLPK